MLGSAPGTITFFAHKECVYVYSTLELGWVGLPTTLAAAEPFASSLKQRF